jgi:hypothetical protein
MAGALLTDAAASAYTATVEHDCQDILGILHAVHLTGRRPQPVRDSWPVRRDLVHTAVRAVPRGSRPASGPVIWLDARDVVRIDWSTLGPSVGGRTRAHSCARGYRPKRRRR